MTFDGQAFLDRFDEREAVKREQALARFAAKVRFDPVTGCVIWTAGTSSGRAGEVRYGAFKYDGKRWPAHRWAAKFIHGLSIREGNEAQHTCANTLCVQHLTSGIHPSGNLRQFWVLVHKGYDPTEDDETEEGSEPAADNPAPSVRHEPPEWLRPFIDHSEAGARRCG